MFTYFIKRAREIRRFHVAVVQRRLRNVQKSVMHVQSCCFANLNLLLFCHSCCRRHRRCSRVPFVVIQKFCHYGNVTSHFSLLLGGELTSCWRLRWWRDDREPRTEGRTLTDCGDPCSSYPFFATFSVELNTMSTPF